MGASDRPAAGPVLHRKKDTSEEAGRDNISPNNRRNLLSKEDHLSMQLQLSRDAREFLLFVSHCCIKGFLK